MLFRLYCTAGKFILHVFCVYKTVQRRCGLSFDIVDKIMKSINDGDKPERRHLRKQNVKILFTKSILSFFFPFVFPLLTYKK